MPTYITLYNLTDQGIKNIKDAPARYEEGIKQFEAVGGKVIGFYATMGEYDYVGIGEAPNDEIAMSFALATGSLGNVRFSWKVALKKVEILTRISSKKSNHWWATL